MATSKKKPSPQQAATPKRPKGPVAPVVSTGYWLAKQEPTTYSWETFVKDQGTAWTGVRNFAARNNLRAMAKGDQVLFYHSVVGKCVMGVAKVRKTAYPDPTAEEGDWVCVELAPDRPLKKPVTMEEIKEVPTLQEMVLLKNSRLSVQPLTEAEFRKILKMGEG